MHATFLKTRNKSTQERLKVYGKNSINKIVNVNAKRILYFALGKVLNKST